MLLRTTRDLGGHHAVALGIASDPYYRLEIQRLLDNINSITTDGVYAKQAWRKGFRAQAKHFLSPLETKILADHSDTELMARSLAIRITTAQSAIKMVQQRFKLGALDPNMVGFVYVKGGRTSAWYSHFVERGTPKTKAYHFMRGIMYKHAKSSQDAFIIAFKKTIERRIRQIDRETRAHVRKMQAA